MPRSVPRRSLTFREGCDDFFEPRDETNVPEDVAKVGVARVDACADALANVEHKPSDLEDKPCAPLDVVPCLVLELEPIV